MPPARGRRPATRRGRRRRRQRGVRWGRWLVVLLLAGGGGAGGYYGYGEYIKRNHVSLEGVGASAAPAAAAEAEYARPDPAAEFGLPQLRWCLREQIRIEVLEERTRTNTEINKVIALYQTAQRLCAPAEEQPAALRLEAQAHVEERAAAIRAETLDDELFILAEVEGAEWQGTEMVRDAQMLLKDLGYDAGGVDGRLGTKTRAAIRAFQEDEGVAQSGEVDVGLLSRLRQARSRQQ